MRAYLALAYCAFRRTVAYPFEVWSMMASNLIRLVLYISVWSVLLQGHQDRASTLAYVTAVYFMDRINFAHYTWHLPYEIRTGNIAVGLIKPISQPLRLLWEQWGENTVYLAQALPVYIGAWALMPVAWPSAERLALFFLTALMGHLVFMLVVLLVGTVSFWTLRSNGTVWFMWLGWNVLSGKVVPLWFMPDWLRTLSEWLPFSQAFYVPAAVLTGGLEGAALLTALFRQALWVGLGALAVHAIWAAATRKVVVQGG